MPPNQDSQTTFKPNLTCIFLSARTRYIISIPNGGPCMYEKVQKEDFLKKDSRELNFFLVLGSYESPEGLER